MSAGDSLLLQCQKVGHARQRSDAMAQHNALGAWALGRGSLQLSSAHTKPGMAAACTCQGQASDGFRSPSVPEMDWKANLSLALGKRQSAESDSVFSTWDTSSDQSLPGGSLGVAHLAFNAPFPKKSLLAGQSAPPSVPCMMTFISSLLHARGHSVPVRNSVLLN